MRTALLPFLALAALAACAPAAPAPGGDAPAAALPAAPPDLRGAITAWEGGGRIRVEADPGEGSGSAKAIVAVDARTRVLRPDGALADPAELAVGRTVRVWFEGPVAESYPAQARAGTVVIEPAP